MPDMRTITYQCVTCTRIDIDRYPRRDNLPDETLKIVRCDDCTKQRVPLPPRGS